MQRMVKRLLLRISSSVPDLLALYMAALKYRQVGGYLPPEYSSRHHNPIQKIRAYYPPLSSLQH